MTTGTSQLFDEGAAGKKRRRQLIVGIVLAVVGIHVVIGIGAGFLIVAKYLNPPPATFEVKKNIKLPAKEREHKMSMAEFDAMTPKPSFNDNLSSLRPTDFALPDLPKVPMDQMLPLDPAAIVSDQVSSMVGTAGLGAGGQGSSGMGQLGEGFAFMGIQSTGRRILLLYDVSTTVVNAAARAGMPMTRVREETEKLIDSLGIDARFGMVQFARNYAFFESELLPASDQNRDRAREWLGQYFATEGSMPQSTPNMVRGSPGFLKVLEAAFRMEPDAMFIISDGGFYEGSSSSGGQRKIPYDEIEDMIEELQEALPEPAQINFIGFGMDSEDSREMKSIIRRKGKGEFKEVK